MSSEQLPLAAYDGRPPRQNHSETSHEAADSVEVRLGGLQRQVLDYLATGGATDEEIQDQLNMPPSTQRPRRRELQLHGLVRDSGIRRATRSGRRAVVWEVAVGAKEEE